VTGSNGLISSSSDIRLKENINYITDTKKGLEQILELKPCEFNFKANKEHTQLGLIAQDVEKFIPISVDGKKYEYQAKRDIDNKLVYDEKGDIEYELDEEGNPKIRPRGLDYNAITSTMILSIQELHKQNQEFRELLNTQNEIIQNQQSEITEHKNKINHLTNTQDNLTKQIIDMTNQINNLTKLFSDVINK
jgi:archaellum component FlaC